MNFHTIYPYIILICFIKIILFWKKDVNEIRTKKMPVIYISAFLLTAFITLVLLCEKTLVADGMIHLLILCWTVVILYWCIVTILVQYRFHLYILLGSMLFGLFSSVGNLTIYDDFGISGFCFHWVVGVCFLDAPLNAFIGLVSIIDFFWVRKRIIGSGDYLLLGYPAW